MSASTLGQQEDRSPCFVLQLARFLEGWADRCMTSMTKMGPLDHIYCIAYCEEYRESLHSGLFWRREETYRPMLRRHIFICSCFVSKVWTWLIDMKQSYITELSNCTSVDRNAICSRCARDGTLLDILLIRWRMKMRRKFIVSKT